MVPKSSMPTNSEGKNPSLISFFSSFLSATVVHARASLLSTRSKKNQEQRKSSADTCNNQSITPVQIKRRHVPILPHHPLILRQPPLPIPRHQHPFRNPPPPPPHPDIPPPTPRPPPHPPFAPEVMHQSVNVPTLLGSSRRRAQLRRQDRDVRAGALVFGQDALEVIELVFADLGVGGEDLLR
jgi:hypothetical protein